jgi:hypothetical protein
MNRIRYSIELGVNDPSTEYRECVGEMGPFFTKRGAERVMQSAFGKPAPVRGFFEHGENGHLRHLPIVGATIERFSDKHGTFESWDFEGPEPESQGSGRAE